ncbi:MAG TPA: hypothetical protein VLL48_07540, partial [Longimicrobiales bacterium]|nr:hypothetical protein [Longimicrobiales bacterium]
GGRLGALESSGARTWTHRTEGAAARILRSAGLRAHAAVPSFWRHGYSRELRRLSSVSESGWWATP